MSKCEQQSPTFSLNLFSDDNSIGFSLGSNTSSLKELEESVDTLTEIGKKLDKFCTRINKTRPPKPTV